MIKGRGRNAMLAVPCSKQCADAAVKESGLLGKSRKSRQLQHMHKAIWQLSGSARRSNDDAEAASVGYLVPFAQPQ